MVESGFGVRPDEGVAFRNKYAALLESSQSGTQNLEHPSQAISAVQLIAYRILIGA